MLQRLKIKQVILPLVFVFAVTDGLELAQLLSNYAKVSVNNGLKTNSSAHSNQTATSTVAPTTTANYSITVLPLDNEDDSEEVEEDEYEDFDDLQAATEVPRSEPFNKGIKVPPNLMTYVNGLVNLLALFVNSQARRPGASKPRQGDRYELADNINNLAEDRFHPSTSTKKFKTEQGVYDGYQQYNTNQESYSSNEGKTSYDSDATQYNVVNPETMMDVKTTETNKMKPPMNDYMSQNDVEIQQSYSYELTEAPKHKPMEGPSGYSYMKPQSKEVYYPMKKKPNPKPSPSDYIDDEQDHASEPIYQPWMKAAKQKKKTPPPLPELENHPQMAPVYYPWMSNGKNKAKPVPPPEEEEEEDEEEGHNEPDHHYYPWMSKNKPKKVQPAPSLEEDPGHEVPDHHYYPWLSGSPPIKAKPPKEEDHADDDHLPTYYPWDSPPKNAKPPPIEDNDPEETPSKGKPPKDDHSLLYYPYYPAAHDHDHFHHDEHQHDEEEHDMKDEDRESKHPYGYYNLGRKLWYVPLFFSLYFIIYIGALILKSIARHKIQLPEKLHELTDHHNHDRRQSKSLDDITERVYNGIDNGKNKFM